VNNHATNYFPINGVIELAFDNIPAGTIVDDVVLSTTSYAVSGISAYAEIEDNTVKVTPSSSLTAGRDYYLKFTLKVGINKIWGVPDLPATGTYDPVRITDEATGDRITFFTARALAIDTASPNTNISLSTPTTLAPDKNIVIQFNQPIASVAKAELWYVRGASAPRPTYGRTAYVAPGDAAEVISNGNLSKDKKLLTIKPAYLLAPGANFIVRLKVTSEDGQILVYDSTDTADPTNYVGGAKNNDIGNTSGTEISISGPVVEGVKQTQKLSGTTLTVTSTLPLSNTAGTTVDLEFAPPRRSFAVDYTLYSISDRVGIWSSTGNVNNQSANDVTAWSITGVSLPAIGPGEVHTNNENIRFKVRGTSDVGYIVDSNTTPAITFN
jgi:hypothetical protein